MPNDNTAAPSFFESIAGRKRKRASAKGCEGRPALNGKKCPTYIVDEDGDSKRVGRRDIGDIPNSTMVLRYVGDGRPDLSKLTREQRMGWLPLPDDWEFTPVFAALAGKTQGQILHEYGLHDVAHTGIGYGSAIGAWMSACAQDQSLATADYLLFALHMYNNATRLTVDEAFQWFPGDIPSMKSVRSLVGYLDELGIRDSVSRQYRELLALARAHSESGHSSIYEQASVNLYELGNSVETLRAIDNQDVARWLVEDVLFIDRERVAIGLTSSPRLLTVDEINRRRGRYEAWHQLIQAHPELDQVITRYRETSMRNGHHGRNNQFQQLLDGFAAGDADSVRLVRALSVADTTGEAWSDVAVWAATMLETCPVSALSDTQISTVLGSWDLRYELRWLHGRGLTASVDTVNDLLFAQTVAGQTRALSYKDVRGITDGSSFSRETLAALTVKAESLNDTEHSGDLRGAIKRYLTTAEQVASELRGVGVDPDVVAVAAMKVLSAPPRVQPEGLVWETRLPVDYEAVGARIKAAALAEHSPSSEGSGLRYRVAVGADLTGDPTYGIEWTRPVEPGRMLLGNLDPQHDGGRDSRAAIEAALDAPLPPLGATLQTIRPDLDAYGAMAVLSARMEGADLSSQDLLSRVKTIASADRRADLDEAWSPKSYDPEFIDNSEIVGLSRVVREMEPAEAVIRVGEWLREGTLPIAAERAIEERRASQRAMAEQYSAQKASGESVLRGSTTPWIAAVNVAPDVVYHDAPVAVLSKPLNDGFKHTIAVHPGFDWSIPSELVRALNERETELGGNPEWGGPNNGKLLGSPQKGNSQIPTQEFRDICARYLG